MNRPHRAIVFLSFVLACAGSFLATELQRKAFAARNSAGTYSLPTGNPVVSGTSISTSWANSTLSDLANEVTNSLDRNGRGAMLAQLPLSNGLVSAPSLTWSAETNSGWYRAATNDFRFAINGADVFTLDATASKYDKSIGTSLTSPITLVNTNHCTQGTTQTLSGVTAGSSCSASLESVAFAGAFAVCAVTATNTFEYQLCNVGGPTWSPGGLAKVDIRMFKP